MENINFKNKDDFAKCEKLSFDGVLDFREFPDAEYKYFDKLAQLYKDFKNGYVSKQRAAEEKQKYKSDYDISAKTAEDYKAVYKAYQDNVKLAGTLLAEIEKSKDRSEIYVKMAELIGILINDETFAGRQNGK